MTDLGQGALQAQRKRSARRCRHHASCRSLEQRDTNAFFEVAHCDAYGGLRDAETFGNGRHVVLLGQRDECANAPLVRQHAEYRGIAYGAFLNKRGKLRASALHLDTHTPCTHEERATVFG
jgi:hypothetical protein